VRVCVFVCVGVDLRFKHATNAPQTRQKHATTNTHSVPYTCRKHARNTITPHSRHNKQTQTPLFNRESVMIRAILRSAPEGDTSQHEPYQLPALQVRPLPLSTNPPPHPPPHPHLHTHRHRGWGGGMRDWLLQTSEYTHARVLARTLSPSLSLFSLSLFLSPSPLTVVEGEM
jgi:hypothetical protein